MRIPGRVLSVTLAGGMALVGLAVAAGQEGSTAKPAAKNSTDDNSVHRITLPQYPPELPEGPGKEVFEKNCLICHSARYVAMQPGFTKTVWQGEVQKMIAVYGAPIAAGDKEAIVEYLVSWRGVTQDAPAHPQEHASPK